MFGVIKYGLLLLMCISALSKGYANAVDSLKTAEDVRKFLAANLGENGIVFLDQCSDIFRPEKIKIYSFEPDTVMEPDFNTGGMRMKIIRPDSNSYYKLDTQSYPSNYSFAQADKIMAKSSFHFYKADIDGDGHTDLVVDAGILIVVMDKGSGFEGHMFADDPHLDSYGFTSFMPMPDGSTALLLRHGHSQRLPIEQQHSLRQDKINYIKDTITDNGTIPIVFNVDTVVYRSNGFVRYNPHFVHVGISKIVYYYRISQGLSDFDRDDCLEINKNGQCFMRYLHLDANFSSVLDNSKLNDLWNLISYIDLKSKESSYKDLIDHATGGTFAIYFEDGTVKKIVTWAYCPVLELGYLSKKISDISKSLHWQQTARRCDFLCPCPLPSGND